MEHKLKLIIILLLLITHGTGFTEDYTDIANRITSCFSQNVKKDKGMSLIGSGGAMMDNVKQIYLHYAKVGNVDINEARILLVRSVQNLLLRINTCKAIKPFLICFPFTPNELDFTISFEKHNGTRPDPNYVSFVSLSNGRIFYSYYDNKQKGYYKDYSETYAEALHRMNF